MVNRVVEVSENLGMKINIEKIELQHMGRAHKDFHCHKESEPQANRQLYWEGNLRPKEENISDIKGE